MKIERCCSRIVPEGIYINKPSILITGDARLVGIHEINSYRDHLIDINVSGMVLLKKSIVYQTI